MNIRILAAAAAGTVALFLLGWLVYGLLLDPYFKAHMIEYPGLMKGPMPDMVPLVLANFVIALLFAFVFEYWASIRTFSTGLIGGAVIMLLISLYVDLSYLAFMNIWKDILPVIIDVLAATFLGAMTGGVVGLVLGIMNKQTAAAKA